LENVFNYVLVADERIENDLSDGFVYFWFDGLTPMVSVLERESSTWTAKARPLVTVNRGESILSQRRDPESYFEMFELASALESIRVYILRPTVYLLTRSRAQDTPSSGALTVGEPKRATGTHVRR
jgi:hypothetical protein